MRSQAQNLILDNNEYQIRNPLSVNWKLFRWSNGYFKHYLTHNEIYRFELVPKYYWGTARYWDIILLLNDIPNIFDLYPGTEIWVPKLQDVEKFLLDNAVTED